MAGHPTNRAVNQFRGKLEDNICHTSELLVSFYLRPDDVLPSLLRYGFAQIRKSDTMRDVQSSRHEENKILRVTKRVTMS